MEAGYAPRDVFVEELVKRWGDAPDDAFVGRQEREYLTATGQLHDLEFILGHVDDLSDVYALRGGELVRAAP